jgi:protease IV
MPGRRAGRKTRSGILARMHRLAAIALVGLILAGCSVISLDLSPRIRPLEEETVEGRGTAKILLMDLSGFLTDETPSGVLTIGTPPPRVPLLVRVREELKKAGEDPSVRGLLVRINSPGGTVTASDIIFRELQAFKARRDIPVVAVMMDVAASGGYYIALAADTIVAHPTSVTGSIGVIMLTLNAEGLLEKVGLRASAIKSGERKDMGSPLRALTEDERAIFQSVIDELQRQFVDKVVERRGLDRETAARIADGRIYTAEQALGLRLIDRVGYVPDGLEIARRAMGVQDARVIVYRRPRQYRATYYAQAESQAPGIDRTFSHLAGLVGSGPRFLYLWAP